MTKKEIIKEINKTKKDLRYCYKREEVCCCIGGEQEIYELEEKLKMLEEKLEEEF